MEKKLRAKLEDEVKELRSALAAQKLASTAMAASGSTDQLGNAFSVSGQASAESLEELRRKFSEAEEKVKPGFFFARYSGNTKQGFVRDFELDHFLTQLDDKKC